MRFPSLIALVLALFALVQPAGAQSIILRPAAIPLKGEIGQSVSQTLTMQNETDVPLEFDILAQDVVVRDGKRVFVEAGRVPGSIAATAVIEPRKVRVEPHASASAKVMFTLPHGMQHRAVVALFKGRTPVQSGNRKATLSLGTLFTFAIGDHVSVSGKLTATPPTASSNAMFTGRLVNDGAEPVVPSGMAVVMDAQGRMVAKSAFASHRLLPGESGRFVSEYPGELPSGEYRALATFDIGGKPYTLTSQLLVP
jgi:hypothetical protein